MARRDASLTMGRGRRLQLGVLAAGDGRLGAVQATEHFDVVFVSERDVGPASIEAVLLEWHPQAPAVARRLRAGGYRAPIIAALAAPSAEEVVCALSHGCDDAQPFPMHPQELVMRITAIRRCAAVEPRPPKRIRSGRLDIGFDGSNPEIDGRSLKVSPNCAKILAIIATSQQPVSASRIATALYGTEPPSSRTINTYLWKLRSIMATATGDDRWLQRRDEGYVLRS